jgi:hypothetical protein
VDLHDLDVDACTCEESRDDTSCTAGPDDQDTFDGGHGSSSG